DLDLGMTDLAVRRVHAHALLGAERLLVVLDRGARVVDGEVRSDGVVALGNRLDSHGLRLLGALTRATLASIPVTFCRLCEIRSTCARHTPRVVPARAADAWTDDGRRARRAPRGIRADRATRRARADSRRRPDRVRAWPLGRLPAGARLPHEADGA